MINAVKSLVYVGPSGSDDSGDGTRENPFATIKKAFAFIATHEEPTDIGVHLLPGVFKLDDSVLMDIVW